MFPHAVTIYNKYKDNGTEKWQRTVLQGVLWNAVKGATIRRTGVASADSLQLIIPQSVCVSKKYLPPKEWVRSDKKSRYWTLQSGDTVLLGVVAHEVARSSSELQPYDDCLAITGVDTHSYGAGMDCWEVSAK